MKICIPGPESLNEIQELISSLAHLYVDEGDMPSWFMNTLTLDSLKSRFADESLYHRVWIEQDELVGYIAFKKPSHLYHLFVKETHQNRGIARALWNNVIDGCPSQVYTVRSSRFAVPVYESFGFVKSGSEKNKDGIVYQEMTLNMPEQFE